MAKSGSDEAQAVRRGWTKRKAVFVIGAIFAVLLVYSGIAFAAGDETSDGAGQSEALSSPPY